MDTGGCLFSFVVLLSLFAVLVVGIVLYSSQSGRQREDRRQLGERLAHKLGGTAEFSTGDEWPELRFTLHGRSAGLEIHEGNDSPPYTRVVVDVRGISPGALKIFPDDVPDLFKRLLRMQDIVIGNEAFDRDFIVQATPVSLAERIFSRERRSRAVGIVRRLGRLGPPSIDLGGQELSFKVDGLIEEFGPLMSLVEAASAWVELLLELFSATEVFWVATQPEQVGLCLVCGTALKDSVVHCTKCRTPHHEECWQYAGKCSTFACGETTYLKDGQAVRMPPRRQTPDEWLREETERDRRETGGGLRAPLGSMPAVEQALRRFEQRQRERRR